MYLHLVVRVGAILGRALERDLEPVPRLAGERFAALPLRWIADEACAHHGNTTDMPIVMVPAAAVAAPACALSVSQCSTVTSRPMPA